MTVTYREDKATQAAARLLRLAGGKLNHMKLMKLLYLADRRALIQWGRPITFDWYVSMPHGPSCCSQTPRVCAPVPAEAPLAPAVGRAQPVPP